jgi:hypothetical protein
MAGIERPAKPLMIAQVPYSHLVLSKANDDKGFATFQDNSCADGTDTVTPS